MNTIEKEIAKLKRDLLNMFLLVESQWEKSARAVLDFDQEIAAEISATETRVNAMEIAIDRECENLLALHAPVAIDLRFVLSAYKINHELERIADIAESISIYVANNKKAYPKEVIAQVGLDDMLKQLLIMIKNIADAFEEEDTKVARKVFLKDKILNQYNADAAKIILANLKEYDGENLLFLLSTIRKIERAGDSVKNIGEEIIFHLEAKILKHKQSSNK